MMFIASGVTLSAAIRKSPSFSRSSSSTTITIFPFRISSMASSIVLNGDVDISWELICLLYKVLLYLFFIGIHVSDGAFLKACLHSVVNFKKNRIVINGADNTHHAPASQNLVTLLHLTNFGLNLFLAFGLRADNKKVENKENGAQKNEVNHCASAISLGRGHHKKRV